jgi:ATP-dependent DNA helicase RecG
MHTFDAMPCIGATIADLDLPIIKRDYLHRAVAEDVLADDKRDLEEQLASLGFYDLKYNCPTYGAIVLFGANPERYLPGSYIQYVRFKGKDKGGEILNEFKFNGNLCRALVKIDNFIETGVAMKRPVPVSALREETYSKYPYWATRELLMNAVMHRDYESNAAVQFYEYDDRIEIQNPGGLYGKVRPDNFPNVNDYRNPFIAEAMKTLGYVNRFSRGVNRVQKELVENGNGLAVFNLTLITAFRVVENVSDKYYEYGEDADIVIVMPDETAKKTAKNIVEETAKNAIEEPDKETVKETVEKTAKKTAKKLPKNCQKNCQKQDANHS